MGPIQSIQPDTGIRAVFTAVNTRAFLSHHPLTIYKLFAAVLRLASLVDHSHKQQT